MHCSETRRAARRGALSAESAAAPVSLARHVRGAESCEVPRTLSGARAGPLGRGLLYRGDQRRRLSTAFFFFFLACTIGYTALTYNIIISITTAPFDGTQAATTRLHALCHTHTSSVGARAVTRLACSDQTRESQTRWSNTTAKPGERSRSPLALPAGAGGPPPSMPSSSSRTALPSEVKDCTFPKRPHKRCAASRSLPWIDR